MSVRNEAKVNFLGLGTVVYLGMETRFKLLEEAIKSRDYAQIELIRTKTKEEEEKVLRRTIMLLVAMLAILVFGAIL